MAPLPGKVNGTEMESGIALAEHYVADHSLDHSGDSKSGQCHQDENERPLALVQHAAILARRAIWGARG
jgi:hypothetical protein